MEAAESAGSVWLYWLPLDGLRGALPALPAVPHPTLSCSLEPLHLLWLLLGLPCPHMVGLWIVMRLRAASWVPEFGIPPIVFNFSPWTFLQSQPLQPQHWKTRLCWIQPLSTWGKCLWYRDGLCGFQNIMSEHNFPFIFSSFIRKNFWTRTVLLSVLIMLLTKDITSFCWGWSQSILGNSGCHRDFNKGSNYVGSN